MIVIVSLAFIDGNLYTNPLAVIWLSIGALELPAIITSWLNINALPSIVSVTTTFVKSPPDALTVIV